MKLRNLHIEDYKMFKDFDKGILALRNDLAFERMDFEEDN
jgi:hypothetical protein